MESWAQLAALFIWAFVGIPLWFMFLQQVFKASQMEKDMEVVYRRTGTYPEETSSDSIRAFVFLILVLAGAIGGAVGVLVMFS